MRIWSSSRYGSSRADFVLGQLRWLGRVSTGGGEYYAYMLCWELVKAVGGYICKAGKTSGS